MKSTRIRSITTKLDEMPDLPAMVPAHSGIAWLSEATSLVASGPYLRIPTRTGRGRCEQAAEIFDRLVAGADIDDPVDLPGSGPVLFGSWTFDPDVPGSEAVIPSVLYGSGDGIAWRTETTLGPFNDLPQAAPMPGASSRGAGLDEQGWMEAVRQAIEAIRRGHLEKVVLARQIMVEAPRAFIQGDLARRLRLEYPGCFTFCFDNLVGASPELLIRRLGDVVDSIPLAGSARRGVTDREDAQLGTQLRESAKNLREHSLAVETVANRLAPFCSELLREPEPSLLLLANLQHLSTKIQGRLKGSPSALALAGALHPTAAVCGVPQERALDAIRSLENFERGRYAGPVGWTDHRGDGEWALALRCAQIRGKGARIFAGAGIVAGSDPATELGETALKLQAMLHALQPFLQS